MERRKSIKEIDKKASWTNGHVSLNGKDHQMLTTMKEKRQNCLEIQNMSDGLKRSERRKQRY